MAGNADAFAASLAQLGKRIEDGSAAALRAHGDDVLQATQQDGVVPIDTGALRDSGFVEGPLTGSGRSTVRIGFDRPYGLMVHEAPQADRRTGIHKFLEVTITAKAPDLGDRLREKIG